MINATALVERAAALIRAYAARGWTIATAESCTGGLVAALLTEIPGSSAVVERGFVTYSNQAKADLLGISSDLIAAHGAVSGPVARAMAEGALRGSQVDAAVAVTGVAGPGGATVAKPVGLVHFGLAVRGRPTLHRERRYGDLGRSVVRARAVEESLSLLEQALAEPT
jgi:nicotinamide-nucleotide amidase